MDDKVKMNLKFKVDGKEYNSRDEMPENIRQLYDSIIGASKQDEANNSGRAGKRSEVERTILAQHGHTDWAEKHIEPRSSVPKWIRIVLFAVVALGVLYILLQFR